MENKTTLEALDEKQSWPLDKKITHALKRIQEFYAFMDGKVYVAFSGGKDSTVLLHLVRSLYPEAIAVFSNTTNEFVEILEFIKKVDNVVEVKPKMTFNETVKKFGFPLVSKKVSRQIKDIKHPTGNNEATRRLYLTGIKTDGTMSRDFKLAKKWHPLITADFELTSQCCDILKKEPMHRYEKESKRKPFVGTMADESGSRKMSYIKTGCNSFEKGKIMSKPMSIWTEADVWEYIERFDVPYSKIYDPVYDEEGNVVIEGEKRTGCAYCAYGAHLEKSSLTEKNRFERLKLRKPKQYKKIMALQNNGVTFTEALSFIKVNH